MAFFNSGSYRNEFKKAMDNVYSLFCLNGQEMQVEAEVKEIDDMIESLVFLGSH
jgi:hypothetical protein